MKTATEEDFQRRLRAIKRMVAGRPPQPSPDDATTSATPPARNETAPRRPGPDRTAFVRAIA